MKEEIKFRLGDRVYAPFHGYGVVTAIHEDACVYPIEVTWDDSGLKNMEDVNTFTADGLLSKYYANTDTILTVVKGSHKRNRRKEMAVSKFKVGDRVYCPCHGYGTVTKIHDDGQEYPIVVTWDEKQHGCDVSIFTPDGAAVKGLNDDADDIVLVKKATPKEVKAMKEYSKFKVGHRVRSREFGVGVVVSEHTYPITVKWTDGSLDGTYSSFTLEGHYYNHRSDAEKDITLLEGEGTVEEGKVKTDAINPPHYRVKGIPEAYDIMTHLMNREQLEGFLWGNIIKYAYRYGRKGDKAETAGKIAWYATKLKELEECESK